MTVQEFLDQLKKDNEDQFKIVSKLRELVLKTNPTIEEIKYGGLLYSFDKPYTGIYVSKGHVSMEFSNGATFDDPEKLLQGAGKKRRHLKFKTLAEVEDTTVTEFLKQAV